MQPAGRFRIASDHPSLAGHFPGRPIVPGVVLLDEMFAVIGSRRVASLSTVKFLVPVLPGQEVAVSLGERPDGRLAFECMVAGRAVLRGTLVFGTAR